MSKARNISQRTRVEERDCNTESWIQMMKDVKVEGKVIRRNRVHLKPDKQVKITEPSLKSEEQKPKDQLAPPTHQSMHVKPQNRPQRLRKLNAPI